MHGNQMQNDDNGNLINKFHINKAADLPPYLL